MSELFSASLEPHPCVVCGACCHQYRVEFSVYELQSMGGSVPDALAHEVSGNRWRMNGTDKHPVRCVALVGRCGKQSLCSIYEQRPTPCRQFAMGDERCASARQHHGLPPLPAGDLPLAA